MSETEYLIKICEVKFNCVCVTTLLKQQVVCKDTQTFKAHMYRYHRVFFSTL